MYSATMLKPANNMITPRLSTLSWKKYITAMTTSALSETLLTKTQSVSRRRNTCERV